MSTTDTWEAMGVQPDLLTPNPLTPREQVVLYRQLRRATRHPDAAVAQTAADTMNDPDMFLVASQNVAANATRAPGQHPFLSWLLANLPAIINIIMGLFGGGKIPPLPPLPIPLPPVVPTPAPSPPAVSPPPFTPQGLGGDAVGLALPSIPPWIQSMLLQWMLSAIQKAVPQIEAQLPTAEAWLEAQLKKAFGG